jgi:hypothetical protein
MATACPRPQPFAKTRQSNRGWLRQSDPFTPAVATAMRRLGWFILAGSLTVAVLRAVSTDLLLHT